LILLAVLLITPWIGSAGISWHRVYDGLSPDREIFNVRIPRILFGAIVGGALAVSGVLFQAILRNSLATPFTLGISSGSSFGAVLAIWLGLADIVIFKVPLISVAAFIGAFITIFLVFFIATTSNALPTFTLLLGGVTLNFVFGALIVFLQYASTFGQSYMMTRWMMGSLDAADYYTVARTVPFVAVALAILMWISPQLNPLAAGEEWAAARGVNVRRLKTLSYFLGSVLTGAVTAFSGPIGFVGIIVPHSLRLLVGADHRILIPGSFFLGAAFLVLCDTAARTILSPTEIPVGVITALLGGPFFIFLLKRKRGELW
jgi:iron complex transport system permease protein